MKLLFLALAFVTCGQAQAEDGFAVVFRNCKLAVANLAKSPSEKDSLKIISGDEQSLVCSNKKASTSCTYLDANNKVIATVEYKVLRETKHQYELTAPDHSSRIFVARELGTAYMVSNVVIPSAPQLGGSKTCTGNYVSDDRLKRGVASKQK